MERSRFGEAELIDLERDELATDHSRVGELLLRSWGLSADLARVVGAHHDSDALRDEATLRDRARILEAAWLSTRAMTSPAHAWERKWISQQTAEHLGVHPGELQRFDERIRKAFRDEARHYGIPIEEDPAATRPGALSRR